MTSLTTLSALLQRYWPLALMLALTGTSLFLGLKNDALKADKAALAAQLSVAEDRADDYLVLLSQRDQLIDKQNEGITALADAAEANRETYQRQYAAADARASLHDDRAEQIMALTADTTDELAQCRAARQLLEAELVS